MLSQAFVSQDRARQKYLARDMVRLRDTETGALLHLDGTSSTKQIDQSWLGFLHQAEKLKKRAESAGKDWNYTPVHRKFLDRKEGT